MTGLPNIISWLATIRLGNISKRTVGYKIVCFNCRKAFNAPAGSRQIQASHCPDCGGKVAQLWHRFRPPRRDARKKWEAVKFLYQHGFDYYDHFLTTDGQYVAYPTTMLAAKEFVKAYVPRKLRKSVE